MPGLVGIVGADDRAQGEREIISARALMSHFKTYLHGPVYCNAQLSASYVSLPSKNEKDLHLDRIDCAVWLEGEVYAVSGRSINNAEFISVLLQNYKENLLANFLKDVDGYYTAVLHDKEKGVVLLISDRYGLRPLYIWNSQDFFAWASEMKAFLALSQFKPRIRNDSVECFLNVGHLLGDITWFEDVYLLSPSTILTYDIKSKKISKEGYWSWTNIRPQRCSFADAAHQLGKLILESIDRRISRNDRIGISLSGGLDSRAIVAGYRGNEKPYLFTYGQPSCADHIIAQQVADKLGAQFHFYPLTEDNWLDGRINGIWMCDGTANMMHMHALSGWLNTTGCFDINLNGFAGDLIMGGSFLKGRIYNTRINKRIAKELYDEWHFFDNADNAFYDCQHIDPYLLNNRVRRFTAGGSNLGLAYVEQRKPFTDNLIMEFVFSLPDEYRVNSRIYNKTLLTMSPVLFNDIPWQTTGRPISAEKNEHLHVDLRYYCKMLTSQAKDRIKRSPCGPAIRRFKNSFCKPNNRSYHNYGEWFRTGRLRNLINSLLINKDAIYKSLVPSINFEKNIIIPHMSGKVDNSEYIGRALTLEIWLQQVISKQPVIKRPV